MNASSGFRLSGGRTRSAGSSRTNPVTPSTITSGFHVGEKDPRAHDRGAAPLAPHPDAQGRYRPGANLAGRLAEDAPARRTPAAEPAHRRPVMALLAATAAPREPAGRLWDASAFISYRPYRRGSTDRVSLRILNPVSPGPPAARSRPGPGQARGRRRAVP